MRLIPFYAENARVGTYWLRVSDGKVRGCIPDPDDRTAAEEIKAPLDYTRISWGFTMRRFHPIKKTWLAHRAVDYAAAVGTPIRTVGDGQVREMGKHVANGRFIKISHPAGYETYYLHLSKFASGIRKGIRVRQGQVIGYVGSSGYSTGPHLDFRAKKNGQYINPRKMQSSPGEPIPKSRIEEFVAFIRPFAERLDDPEIREKEILSTRSENTISGLTSHSTEDSASLP